MSDLSQVHPNMDDTCLLPPRVWISLCSLYPVEPRGSCFDIKLTVSVTQCGGNRENADTGDLPHTFPLMFSVSVLNTHIQTRQIKAFVNKTSEELLHPS